MLLKDGESYIIEQVETRNPQKGSNPKVTRVITKDGLFIVEIYGPNIRPSSIRVIDKKERVTSLWDRLHHELERVAWAMNFNLKEIEDMTIEEAKNYIKNKKK